MGREFNLRDNHIQMINPNEKGVISEQIRDYSDVRDERIVSEIVKTFLHCTKSCFQRLAFKSHEMTGNGSTKGQHDHKKSTK